MGAGGGYNILSPCVSVISFICIALSILQALCSWCSNYFRGSRRRDFFFFFQAVKLRLRKALWWSGWEMPENKGSLSADLKHQSKGFDLKSQGRMPWISNTEVLVCQISCRIHCPRRQLSVLIIPMTMSKFNSFLLCKIEIRKYLPHVVVLKIKWLTLRYKTLWIVPGPIQ